MDNRLNSLQSFLNYLYILGSESTSEQELEALYDTHITISHQDRTVNIPFDATAYNCLTNFIETLIKEY